MSNYKRIRHNIFIRSVSTTAFPFHRKYISNSRSTIIDVYHPTMEKLWYNTAKNHLKSDKVVVNVLHAKLYNKVEITHVTRT